MTEEDRKMFYECRRYSAKLTEDVLKMIDKKCGHLEEKYIASIFSITTSNLLGVLLAHFSDNNMSCDKIDQALTNIILAAKETKIGMDKEKENTIIKVKI